MNLRTKTKMVFLKFSANLSFMFQETSSLLERYHLAKQCGFTAVEVAFPYECKFEELATILDKENLHQVLINVYPGDVTKGELGFAALPGKEVEFKNSVNLALTYSKALNCNKVHIMSGIVENPSIENHKTYETNLKYVAGLFEQENIVALIEPINSYSVPNYYMNSFDKAIELIKSINSPNLKLLLDIFHLQHLKGDLTNNIKNYLPYVGHIQIAQVPSRNEPDTSGEINYKYVFNLLKQLNYSGYIGLEYKPALYTQSGLKWMEDMCWNK